MAAKDWQYILAIRIVKSIKSKITTVNITVQHTCLNIDWDYVSTVLKNVGMASYSGEVHRKAFENSHTVVFVFDSDKLVGFGRALSDGVYQAALYDIAVLPEYQGKGIGRIIIDRIVACIPNCNIILYAAPGKDTFYEKLQFRKMKTGMALFTNADAMQQKGFTE